VLLGGLPGAESPLRSRVEVSARPLPGAGRRYAHEIDPHPHVVPGRAVQAQLLDELPFPARALGELRSTLRATAGIFFTSTRRARDFFQDSRRAPRTPSVKSQ